MTDEELRQEFRNIDARFDNIREYFMEFRSEVIQRFDHIEHRLDFQGASLSALTKQAMDSDSSSSRMLRDIADLKRRVEKLESAA